MAVQRDPEGWVPLKIDDMDHLLDQVSEFLTNARLGEALCLCCGRYYTVAEMVPETCFHDCPEQKSQARL
jgi:hypothetical protein